MRISKVDIPFLTSLVDLNLSAHVTVRRIISAVDSPALGQPLDMNQLSNT